MNKVIITQKEIDKFVAIQEVKVMGELVTPCTVLKEIRNNYKEKDYKEVFVLKNIAYLYDTYKEKWIPLYHPSSEVKEGFYNYNILEKLLNITTLDKNRAYTYCDGDEFIYYNPELNAWEYTDGSVREICVIDIKFISNYYVSIPLEEIHDILLKYGLLG